MAKCQVCDMRGFLSFLILWMLSRKPMTGAQLATELTARRGCRPNPGTIYPALGQLVEKKAICVHRNAGREKQYELTQSGREELKTATMAFSRTFKGIIE